MLDLAIVEEAEWPTDCDWGSQLTNAVAAAVKDSPYPQILSMRATVEVSVCLSDDASVHKLNAQWRGKDKPTNVLSFPQIEPDDLNVTLAAETDDGAEILLGDIVLAYETCAREAAEKAVSLTSHATHLVVHGALHLLGFDHIDEADAISMEALERTIMARLGHGDPYALDGVMQHGE